MNMIGTSIHVLNETVTAKKHLHKNKTQLSIANLLNIPHSLRIILFTDQFNIFLETYIQRKTNVKCIEQTKHIAAEDAQI